MNNTNGILINEDKVIDRTIDVYLWVSEDLNNAEVGKLGQHLVDLADRRASDVEQEYVVRREHNYGIDDIHSEPYENEEWWLSKK